MAQGYPTDLADAEWGVLQPLLGLRIIVLLSTKLDGLPSLTVPLLVKPLRFDCGHSGGWDAPTRGRRRLVV
jgi:hypothetical protein